MYEKDRNEDYEELSQRRRAAEDAEGRNHEGRVLTELTKNTKKNKNTTSFSVNFVSSVPL